ncbi:Rad52/Rad22 family DNA repair protein [Thermus albus]|uniref:Rad52/Rad22 family DNA repair protein n=1 Tax=Thermus albus TaxID=2908146 RepID=UPI0024322BFB|nr:Rad52/Rad22 family DNA repair protein [Thermus albus]
MKEIYEQLAQPFPPQEVGWKVQTVNRDRTRGLVVAYVDARTVLDRLDEVVGPEGWQDAYEVLADREHNGTRLVEVKCRLTVLGVTKEDVGEGDTLKAAFSDALKRAAVKFGIGRYLYRLEKTWVPLKDGQIEEKTLAKLRSLLEGR